MQPAEYDFAAPFRPCPASKVSSLRSHVAWLPPGASVISLRSTCPTARCGRPEGRPAGCGRWHRPGALRLGLQPIRAGLSDRQSDRSDAADPSDHCRWAKKSAKRPPASNSATLPKLLNFGPYQVAFSAIIDRGPGRGTTWHRIIAAESGPLVCMVEARAGLTAHCHQCAEPSRTGSAHGMPGGHPFFCIQRWKRPHARTAESPSPARGDVTAPPENFFNKRQEERDAGLKPAGERKKEGRRAG